MEKPFEKLSLADVARHPRPGLNAPRRMEFSPDGKAITYLFSGAGTLLQQLWRYDLATGERRQLTGNETAAPEGEFSIEEQLRRERARLRERGVTDYQFLKVGEAGELVLLVPMGGALWVARGDEALRQLPGTEGALDAKLSPDGARVAFVRDDELWVAPTDGSAGPRQMSSGAGNGVTNGVAEYIAQEEMGRREGFWWSPDGASIAYEQADSVHIPMYPIVHQGRDEPLIEEHRYPFAGKPNARVKIGIVGLDDAAATTRWLDWGAGDDEYLARVAWRPDGSITAQIQPRDQRSIRLMALDPATDEAALLIADQGDPWINLDNDTRYLKSGEILWGNERSGFQHLAVHDANGRHLRDLTSGEWVVTDVAAVDEANRVVYFHGTRESAIERHLHRVSLDGGPVERITEGAGWHATVVAPSTGLYVDSWSHLGASPTMTLRRLEGNAEVATLFADEAATAEALGLRVPELTTFQTEDGTTLHAAIYAPPGAGEDGKRYPLIVSVYGGPHAQMVQDFWGMTIDLRAQFLAQQGYVVLKVDNRGSAKRGLRFEAPIHRDMGRIEVADQVEGVRWIGKRPYVDSERVGIYGWSYGGFMTCMALMRAPELFKVGVAGAPVTHWDGYDTHYTERYMGHPVENAAGYREGSPLSHVEALRGKLLLIHGMVDENVHFRHTARLIAALTAADKAYDLAIFPEERHMPRDAKGLEYMERRIYEYFRDNL